MNKENTGVVTPTQVEFPLLLEFNGRVYFFQRTFAVVVVIDVVHGKKSKISDRFFEAVPDLV